jgi:hypothetical protein
VESIDFSPDGRTLVTAGTDSTTRLIDLAARAVIGAPLPGEDQVLWRALFTPDGARVITISEIHQGVAWGVSPDQWNRLACGIAGRQLSQEEWTVFLPDLPYDPACAGGS